MGIAFIGTSGVPPAIGPVTVGTGTEETGKTLAVVDVAFDEVTDFVDGEDCCDADEQPAIVIVSARTALARATRVSSTALVSIAALQTHGRYPHLQRPAPS